MWTMISITDIENEKGKSRKGDWFNYYTITVNTTALCDKVWQWLATSQWFSPGTAVSSTNKADRHNIT